MSNEFIARKGLISMKSSSFLEDVYISGSLTSVDCVHFDTTYDTASAMPMVPGMARWNADDGTVDIGMLNGVTQQVGQESYYYVKASGNITNGHAVMAVGIVGNSGRIAAASATGSVDAKYLMGIATQDIANGDFGYVTCFGMVRGIDTSAWQTGSVLYYDPTTLGGLTDVAPTAPNPHVVMAMVITSHAANGTLLVRITAGSTLGETDSNVEFGTLNDKDFIFYNSGSGRWENSSLLATGATASYAQSANSSSYSVTASYAQSASSSSYSLSSSYSVTSSYSVLSLTASYALTSSYAATSATSSYVLASNIDAWETVLPGAGTANLILVDHFLAATPAGNSGFSFASNGGGSSVAVAAGQVGHPGIVSISTGTNASGRLTLSQYTDALVFQNGSGLYRMDSAINIPTLSTATQRYTYRFGFGDNLAAGDFVDGVYFEYYDLSSPNWVLKTSANSVRTNVTSSVAVPAGNWETLRIDVLGTQTASFYIDGTLVGQITTNIPSGSARTTGVVHKLEKSVGGTARNVLVDYVKMTYT